MIVRTATCHTLLLCALTLAACSGGDDSPGSSGPSSLIPDGGSGVTAADTDTDTLLQNAANNASRSLSTNFDTLADLNGTGDTIDAGAAGTFSNESVMFLDESLGLNSTNAVVTRDEDSDVISIDPDDNELCQSGFALMGLNPVDGQNCLQMAGEISVELVPVSDDSGTISYRFGGSEVIEVGYAPNASNFRLDLAGLQQVQQRAEQLGIQSDFIDSSLQGVVQMNSTVSSDAVGQERAGFTLSVVEALSISDGEGGSTRLAPSTVLEYEVDAAAGSARMGVDWGALRVLSRGSDALGNPQDTEFALGGLSGEIDIASDSSGVRFSNFGLGNVPLTVTVNDVQSISLGIANTSATVDPVSGQLVFDDPLSIRLALNNLMGLLEAQSRDVDLNIELDVPAGVTLTPEDNGSTRVSGGAIQFNAQGFDGEQSVQQSLVINDGDCVDTAETADGGVFEQVVCDSP